MWLLWSTDLGHIWRILRQASPAYLLLAAGLITVHVLIKFVRYQYILNAQVVRNPFMKTVHYSLAAIYLSFVMPGRVEEVTKAYFIREGGSSGRS